MAEQGIHGEFRPLRIVTHQVQRQFAPVRALHQIGKRNDPARAFMTQYRMVKLRQIGRGAGPQLKSLFGTIARRKPGI
jgi:hypothetical protein